MAKVFESVTIDSNDDGTFSIHFRPSMPEDKDKGDDMDMMVMEGKTMTADSLESVFEKIKSMISENGKSPEKDMNRFFNGPKADEDESVSEE